MAGQLLFDVRGFGWVWVGLSHGFISSPGSGLGWVGSFIWWVGLGWVDENRPTDNSDLHYRHSLVKNDARNFELSW